MADKKGGKKGGLSGEIIPADLSSGKGKSQGRGRGRPEFYPDWDMVDKLLGIQCNQTEVAAVVGCAPETLRHACRRDHQMTWREYSAEKTGIGKAALRRRMFQGAMAGNARLMVFLAKNYLGMTERTEVTGRNGRPIELNSTIDVKKLSDAALREIAAAGVEEGDEDDDD